MQTGKLLCDAVLRGVPLWCERVKGGGNNYIYFPLYPPYIYPLCLGSLIIAVNLLWSECGLLIEQCEEAYIHQTIPFMMTTSTTFPPRKTGLGLSFGLYHNCLFLKWHGVTRLLLIIKSSDFQIECTGTIRCTAIKYFIFMHCLPYCTFAKQGCWCASFFCPLSLR